MSVLPKARAIDRTMWPKSREKDSLQEFVRLVVNSGLVQADVLNEVSAAVHSAVEPSNAARWDRLGLLADALVARGALTNWQCNKLREGRWRGFFLGPSKLLEYAGVTDSEGIYLAEEIYLHRRVHLYVSPCGKHASPCPDRHIADGVQFRVVEVD